MLFSSLVRSYQFKMLIRVLAFASRYMLNFTLNFILRFSCSSSRHPLGHEHSGWFLLGAFGCVCIVKTDEMEQGYRFERCLCVCEWVRGFWCCPISHFAHFLLLFIDHTHCAHSNGFETYFSHFFFYSFCRRLSHSSNGNQNKWDRMRCSAECRCRRRYRVFFWCDECDCETGRQATTQRMQIKYSSLQPI